MRCVFLGLICAFCSPAASESGVISTGDEYWLKRSVGQDVTSEFLACSQRIDQTDTCNIPWLAQKVAESAGKMRRLFDKFPSHYKFDQAECKDLRQAMVVDIETLRLQCTDTVGWPGDCVRLQNAMTRRWADPTFEIGVVCKILNPGPAKAEMPPCSSLVKATIAEVDTLTSCHAFNQSSCVEHFCEVLDQFHWRMQPRNLQLDDATQLYPEGFVLPGCEAMGSYGYRSEDCYLRRDVNGWCDCLCEGMPMISENNDRDCPTEVDKYLMFGRQSVDGIDLHLDCQPELCSMLDSRRNLDQCADLKLPSEQECEAMKLPLVQETCPWLDHSGEDSVMECLDGHRCLVNVSGWSCCEHHYGRGKCPMDLPVMCDTICSGITEYCCGLPGKCTHRGCSPVLRPDPTYMPATTTSTTTLPAAGEGLDPEEGGINIRFQRGSWIWLLLVVPLVVGLVVVCVVIRLQRRPQEFDDPTVKVEAQADKLGAFGIIRPAEKTREATLKTPVVTIIVDDLPQLRPLGIELMELKVIRLHARGQQYGWQVGDIIVEVSGVPVTSFEELWARIQIERDRLPVKFLVERGGAEALDVEERAAINDAEQEAAKKGKRKKSQVVPFVEHIVNQPESMAINGAMTAAVVGWETWDSEPIPDEAWRDEWSEFDPASSTSLRQLGSGGQRSELTTTQFMRSFALTPEAVERQAMKRKDPEAGSARFVHDAWGRAVLKVGGNL